MSLVYGLSKVTAELKESRAAPPDYEEDIFYAAPEDSESTLKDDEENVEDLQGTYLALFMHKLKWSVCIFLTYNN